MEDPTGAQISYVPAPRTYAMGGKIMLSAIVVLFFVVIFILALHVYARCRIIRRRRTQLRHEASRRMRRRHSRLAFVGSENSTLVEFAPARGLDASALISLPIFSFSAQNDIGKVAEEAMDCAVCLCEFQEGEVGRKLPKCNHSFHIDCIDMWFLSHSTCPLCRTAVHTSPPSAQAHSGVGMEVGSRSSESPSSQPCDSFRAQQQQILIPDVSSPSSLSSSSNSSSLPAPVVQACQDSTPRMIKNVQIRIDVPGRSGEAVVEEPSGASPAGSRLMSLKRMLSRDRRFSPRACTSTVSPRELDLERGGDVYQVESPARRQP